MITLYPFQEEAAGLIRKRNCLIADKAGLGKTMSALEPFIKARRGPVLIICPNHAKLWWHSAIRDAKYFESDLPIVIAGKGGRFENGKDLTWVERGEPGFVLSHYEGLRMHYYAKPIGKAWPYYTTWWFGVVLDESHRAKTYSTGISKAVRALAKHARRRVLLTATPRTGWCSDLWSQLNFLYPKKFPNYWAFCKRYLNTVVIPGEGRRPDYHKIISNRRQELLAKRMAPFTLRRTKKGVGLQLPEKLYQTIPIKLSVFQRALYHKVEKGIFLDLDPDRIEDPIYISSTLTRMLMLRQICSLPTLLGIKNAHDRGAGKLVWFEDFMRDFRLTEEPLVVFTYFKGTARAFAKICYPDLDSPPTFTGDDDSAYEPFMDGRIPYFVCTFSKASESLNLQRAATLIMAEPWYSAEKVEQAEDRIHRIGQDRVANIIKLSSIDTLEGDIWKAVEDKRTTAEMFYSMIQRIQLHQLGN